MTIYEINSTPLSSGKVVAVVVAVVVAATEEDPAVEDPEEEAQEDHCTEVGLALCLTLLCNQYLSQETSR
jgi:hypothetical protein